MSKFSSKDIQRHVRQEASRKTPLDEDKIREAHELDCAHMQRLMNATWEEVEEKLSGIGLLPGTPGHAQMRVVWNDFHRELQKKRRS
jgi:hypothetical protein